MKTIIGQITYKNSTLYGLYVLLSFFKIEGQVFGQTVMQCFLVVASNFLLILPFLSESDFKKYQQLFKFLIFLSLGEIVIIFFQVPVFLNFGMGFYLLSKISLLIILNRNREKNHIYSSSNLFVIFSPIILSFFLCFIFYNTSSVGLSTTLLIIIYSAVTAYLFIHIFFLKKNVAKFYLILGLVLSCFHDIYGGFNFFHALIDSKFIACYLLICSANLSLFYGFWKSRNELFI